MRITYLLLEKYKRLMLSNIQRFEYTPKQNLQLLIGSNGSGKSSVLEELTPLPAHHSGFAKGGCKVIHLTHRNNTYELTSKYNGGSGDHSFVKNGEEMNKGNTAAVQKELVWQEFALNREIHNLLVGITPFTSLSTMKRREWLTRLAPVDLDFAFKVFSKAKTAHRDQQGVVKHLIKRMGQENHDLPDDSALNQHKRRIQELTNKLDKLFQERKAGVVSRYDSEQAVQSALQDLTTRAEKILRYHLPEPPKGLEDESAFEAYLAEQNVEYQRQQTLLERMTEEFQKLNEQVPSRDAELTEAQIEDMRRQLRELNQQIQQIKPKVTQYDGVFPLVDLPPDRRPLSKLVQVFDEWMGLIQSFPDNHDGRFSQDRGKAAQERHLQLERQYQQLDNQQTTDARRLARLKGCDTVHCPNCQHQFQPGVNPGEVDKLQAVMNERSPQMEQIEKELAELKSYLESMDDYMTYVRAFRKLVTENPSFTPVWDVCLERKVMVRQPKDYISAAIEWRRVMEEAIHLRELEQNAEVVQHRLRYVDAIDREAITHTDRQRKQLEQEIENTTQRLRVLGQEIQQLERHKKTRVKFKEALERIIADLEQFFNDMDTHRESLYQDAISDETRHVQIHLAQEQEALSRSEVREGVLKEIQNQHDQSVLAQKEYQQLVKALGPTDGLIGRYLMGFMQVVVKLVNSVIAEIWTYPMEVLPSPMEKDELTYKFPLDVNGGSVTAPDIALGSSSQRDITNFAFKLLVMKFLNITDYPLYLDEFGSTFDEQHRQNLIPFLNRMLELGQVNQIFYISHFSSVHGAFNQAQICVLDPNNITVPQTYNQHVNIS